MKSNLGTYLVTGGPGRPKGSGSAQVLGRFVSAVGDVLAQRDLEYRDWLATLDPADLTKILLAIVKVYAPRVVSMEHSGSLIHIHEECEAVAKRISALSDSELAELVQQGEAATVRAGTSEGGTSEA